MEPLISDSNRLTISGDELIFSAIINQYCREFQNWTRYMGRPLYDTALTEGLNTGELDLHLKISFPASNTEIFVPLVYFSDMGMHVFQFPALKRLPGKDVVTTLEMSQFIEFAIAEGMAAYPEWLRPDLGPALLAAIAMGKEKIMLEAALEKKFSSILSLLKERKDSDRALRREMNMAWFRQDLQNRIYHPLWQFELDEVFALIALLGRHQILEEKSMLRYVYEELEYLTKQKQNGAAELIFSQRHLEIDGELFAWIGTYKRPLYNPLHMAFYSAALLHPSTLTCVFSRYFEKEDVTISIRPFDIKRDLQMVHQWFHADHAKVIWKMDWPLKELEHFYRTLLPEELSHSYIGEVNGEPTFNFEVYWATKDILGDYYEVLPSDYGTHLFIAPTDQQKKFPSLITQSIVDWLFLQPEAGRLVGEGSVDSLSALMNKVHVGFKLQHIIEMPHKKAYLNFCIREWYWEKFPPASLTVN